MVVVVVMVVRYMFRFSAIFKIGLLFLLLFLNFKYSLNILDTSPFSDIHIANIFSQSVACLFILLTISFFLTIFFAEQKFVILMKSGLSFFSSAGHGGVLKD